MSTRPLNTGKFNIPPSVHASLEIFSSNSSRSVFVRDLPFCCNTEDLRSLLENEGGITVEDVLICRNSEGKTLQYGCAMFPTPDDVDTVMEKLNGHRYHGRDIRVIRFSKDTLMEASSTGAVLVSFKGITHDLPLITESTIRAAFEQFGDISHVSIRSHLYNSYGIQGGFGFLGFVDSATNNRVVSDINQTVIDGVQYDCNWSKHMSKNHEGNNSNGQQSESFFKRKPRDGNNHYFAGANHQVRVSGENGGPVDSERPNPSSHQHHFLYSASGNSQVPMYPSFHGPSQGMMVSVPGQFVYPGMYGQPLPGQYNGPNTGIPTGGMMIPANAGYYQGQNMMVSAVGPNPIQSIPTALPGNDSRNHQQGQTATQMNPSNTQFAQNGPNPMSVRSHHVERAQSTAGMSAQQRQGQRPSFPSRDNQDVSHQSARTDRQQTVHHGHSSSKSIISASPVSNQHTPPSSSSTTPSPVPIVPSPTPVAVMPTPLPKQPPAHYSYPSNPSNPHGHHQPQLQYSNNQSNTLAVHPAQQQGRGFSPVSAPSEGKLPSPNNAPNLQNSQWTQQQSVQMGNIVPPSPSMSTGGQQGQGWNGTTATPIPASSGSAPHSQQQAYHYPPVNNTANVKVTGQYQGNHEASPTTMTMLPPAAVGGPGATNNNGRYPAHHPSYPQPPQSHYGYQPAYQQPSVSMVHPMDANMHQQMMMFNAASVPTQLNQYASPHSMPVPPPMSMTMPYMMVDGHNHMIMPQMYAAYNPTVPGGPYSSGPVPTTVSPPSQFMAANETPYMDQKDNRNQQHHSHTNQYHTNHHTKARNVHHNGGQHS